MVAFKLHNQDAIKETITKVAHHAIDELVSSELHATVKDVKALAAKIAELSEFCIIDKDIK